MSRHRGKQYKECRDEVVFGVLSFAVIFCMLVVTLAGEGQARTWHVPDEVVTIKAAVEDSAFYGDTVMVAPGLYGLSSGEVFPIAMKNGVVLASESGAAATVIDAQATGRILQCTDLDSATAISGFTMTGGEAASGGGIYCLESFLKISDNIITGNLATAASGRGGGIYCAGGTPRIVNNDIVGNTARHYMGGGIYCNGSSALIEANTISRNKAVFGGGVFNENASPIIRSNLVEGNHATQTGAGLDCYMGSAPLIQGNVVVGNSAEANGAGIACCDTSAPIIMHNTIAGNVAIYGGGIRTLRNSAALIDANIIVDNVDAVYLTSDSGPVTAANNHIYCNTYQAEDYEVINNTSHNIDLSSNFWWVTDALSVAMLIDGASTFIPFRTSLCDSIPGEPSEVTSVTCMTDNTYMHPIAGGVSLGDTLFIQLEGVDWNSSFVEPALVIIGSQRDPHGIGVALLETSTGTGVYRGVAYINSVSSDVNNEIGANSSDAIIVRAHVDSTECDTVTVGATPVEEEKRYGGDPLAGSFGLYPNYPNPFNASTEITYRIPLPAFTTLHIYNISGQIVISLLERSQEPGRYTVHWDGGDTEGKRVASGLYFCRLKAGNFVAARKMILLR
jgi:hypothetical protein